MVTSQLYHGLSKLPDQVKKSWFAFDHSYSDNVFKSVLPILFDKNRKKILDVGGNTGKFSLLCAKYSSEAEIKIMDLPGLVKCCSEKC